MKKILTLLCALMACTAALAGNPLKVTTGKDELKALMSEDAVIALSLDWTATQYDKKMTAKEKFAADYDFVVKDCEAKLIEGFNAKAKTLKMQAAEQGARYQLQIAVENLDAFYAVMRFVPRWEAKMWGKFRIVDLQEGTTLVEGDIKEAEDGTDFVFKEAFGKTFLLLGQKFAKLK